MLTKLIEVNRKKYPFFSYINANSLFYFYIILFAYLSMAWFDEGYSHADEHFQILEMATYKNHANLYGIPWEFNAEIRSTAQIWFVMCLIKIVSIFVSNVSPFLINFLCKAFTAFLSAISCYVFYKNFHKVFATEERQKWFFLFTAFNYISFTQSTHFSSEIISANFFILGLSLLFNKQAQIKDIHYLFIGFLFGAAIITRYQTGIMLFGLIAWQIIFQKNSFKYLLYMLTGTVGVFLIGMLLDSIFYGHFICTAWRYFDFNLIENYAAKFGTSHWTYFNILYALPFGPFYVLGTVYFIFKKPTHVITWIILPFLIVHQMIGHKEIRFLLPIMGFIPFILFDALQILQNTSHRFYIRLEQLRKWIHIIWYFNAISILVYILGHYHLYDTYHYFWENYQNQPTTLYRYSTPDKPLNHGLPLEYYLPNTMHLKNYSKIQPSSSGTHLQLLFLTCEQQLPSEQKATLIYDSCPAGRLGKWYHYFKWTKRSQIFRHKGQVYQI